MRRLVLLLALPIAACAVRPPWSGLEMRLTANGVWVRDGEGTAYELSGPARLASVLPDAQVLLDEGTPRTVRMAGLTWPCTNAHGEIDALEEQIRELTRDRPVWVEQVPDRGNPAREAVFLYYECRTADWSLTSINRLLVCWGYAEVETEYRGPHSARLRESSANRIPGCHACTGMRWSQSNWLCPACRSLRLRDFAAFQAQCRRIGIRNLYAAVAPPQHPYLAARRPRRSPDR